MAWFRQSRILEIDSPALPTWHDEKLFTVSRVRGKEKLGKLHDYMVEIATIDAPDLRVDAAKALVDVDQLVGKQATVSIVLPGKGTFVAGQTGMAGGANVGAGVRKISGLIVMAACIGADDRRAYYRLRIRPWLWLATRNTDSRIYQNLSVVDLTREILQRYPYPYDLRLRGPGFGRTYPPRDYQRMFWESDFGMLTRLWQEWGLTYHFEDMTLVLCDSPGSYHAHGSAYESLRYLAPEGQRIDEEHIDRFSVGRALTTGKVTVRDYDYTQAGAKLDAESADYRERAFDNIEAYAWGDYSQPLAGAMGLSGKPNDVDFEARYLAGVRLEAHRAKSLRAKGRGNLRGLMTGFTFNLVDYPLAPGNGEYLVVSTRIDIQDNAPSTQPASASPQYRCETTFTAQPANTFFRTPQKAKKPRSNGEVAIVAGHGESGAWTDRYARVKVWFPWDRQSEKKQPASCWVRVSSPWQGASYGAIYIPRIGDEVVIGYQDNDPDKPYVAGRHVNQWRQPPWALPHNHALSGWRSQDIDGKQHASNSVVTDDTPGRLQVQVSSDQAASRLVLGSNTRIDGHKGRAQPRGEGFELATGGHGVGRANLGMLLTTEARRDATQPMKDMGETVQRLIHACRQHEDLSRLARQHGAQTPEANQQEAAQAIAAQNAAVKGGAATHDNPSPEMTRPDLVAASAAGIATTATDSTHLASRNDHAVTAGRDVSLSAGRSFMAAVQGAVSLFAAKLGIRLIANQGPVNVEAQNDEMLLKALKNLTVASVGGKLILTAKEEVWIGAGGSYICIDSGGITNGTPGKIFEKAATWSKQGANSQKRLLATPGPMGDTPNFIELVQHYDDMEAVRRAPYTVHFSDGSSVTGKLDNTGFGRLEGVPPGKATVEWGEDMRHWVGNAKRPNSNAGEAGDAQSAIQLVRGLIE